MNEPQQWMYIEELGTKGTKLHKACAEGHVHNILNCLSQGYGEALTEDGQSPLWILARTRSSLACWEALLPHCDPNMSWHGQTLLQYLCAVQQSDAIVLRILQDGRVQPNASAQHVCNLGPLDICLRNLNANLARALLAFGETCTFAQHNLPLPLRLPLLEKPVDFETWLPSLETFLQAVSPDHTNIQGSDGNGIVHLYALYGRNVMSTENPVLMDRRVVHLLQDYSVNLEARNADGLTPLMQALQSGHVSFERALLDCNVSLSTKDSYGRSAIFYARDQSALHALMERGCSLECRCEEGRTPLLDAIAQFQRPTIGALLAAGASVDTSDHKGRTVLHYAVATGQLDVLQLLFQRNLDATVRDAMGRTPLHYLGGSEQQIRRRSPRWNGEGEYRYHRPRKLNKYKYEAYLAILKCLMAHDANLWARDNVGNLPFFFERYHPAMRTWVSAPLSVLHSTHPEPDFELSLLFAMVSAAVTSG